MTTAATFGIAAAVAFGVWLFVLVVLALRTRPDLPRAGPTTMDLGPEPPAIAAFLTERWKVEPASMSATLVDLAARDVLAIEQTSPDNFLIRLRSGRANEPGPFTEYEALVLERVHELAVNGTVACEALALGDESDAQAWQQRFEKSVVADARARGLSRPRWDRTTLAPLFAVAIVVGVLAGIAFVTLPDTNSSSSEDDNPFLGVIGIAAIVVFLLMTSVRALRAERATPAGREAAGRWLGVREYLHHQGTFGEHSPAAVTIWDRYLAYAAALGLARATVEALPLGPEDPRHVWSPNGGWHLVRINLPGRLEFGWGRKPWFVLLVSVGAVVAGLLLLSAVGGMFVNIGSALRDTFTDPGDAPWWAPFAIFGVTLVVFSVPLLFVGGLIVVGGVQGVRAALDLRPEEATGVVVRVRDWQLSDKRAYRIVVVDPGGRQEVRAWRMPAPAPPGVTRGATVHATVSERLGHVWAIAATASA